MPAEPPRRPAGAQRDGAAGVPLGEYALLDVDRRRRTGVPEAIFGQDKTPEQIFALLTELRARDPGAPALAARRAGRGRGPVPGRGGARRSGRRDGDGRGPAARARPGAGADGGDHGPARGPGGRRPAGRARGARRPAGRRGRGRARAAAGPAGGPARGRVPDRGRGHGRGPAQRGHRAGQRAGDRGADQRRLRGRGRWPGRGGDHARLLQPGSGRGQHRQRVRGRRPRGQDHPRGAPVTDQTGSNRPGAAYIDATAGVAGDMLLGALLDAGATVARVQQAITSLGVPGLGLRTETARRGGLACLRAVITLPTVTDRERHLADVLAHVEASDLSPAGKDCAARVFRLLAEAEGAVHGQPPEEVHFHEVGAFDSLADVVGSAAALDDLGLLAPGAVVNCSALAAGSGTVNSRHGRLPVPAPAVVGLAAAAGLTLTGGDLAGERTTPTGAALLAAAATPGGFPDMTVRAVGTGGGGRGPADRPHITRGGVAAPGQREEEVTVVETTVDDIDPRLWPSILQAVRAAGAWDCWCTPIIGRHGRPGQVLTALCAEPVRPVVVAAVFAQTGTLGVRWSRMSRTTMGRQSVPVEVGPDGQRQVVTVKVAGTGQGGEGFGTVTAELAEAEAAAQALGWPVRSVCEAAVAQYRADQSGGGTATTSEASGGGSAAGSHGGSAGLAGADAPGVSGSGPPSRRTKLRNSWRSRNGAVAATSFSWRPLQPRARIATRQRRIAPGSQRSCHSMAAVAGAAGSR